LSHPGPLLKHRYDISLSWLGTDTSIKSDGVELVLCAKNIFNRNEIVISFYFFSLCEYYVFEMYMNNENLE